MTGDGHVEDELRPIFLGKHLQHTAVGFRVGDHAAAGLRALESGDADEAVEAQLLAHAVTPP